MKKTKKVMVFGTFDRLHKGHEYFLSEARKCGDFLTAVVARDKTVKKVKGRLPSENEGERKMSVEKSGLADKVILGSLNDVYEVIMKERPDVICLGYDQKSFVGGLGSFLESIGIDAGIIRIKAYRPDRYKTSLMKNQKKVK